MAYQLETALRNAMADAITSALGTDAIMRIYDGTPPANVGASLSGNNLLVEIPASSTFAAAAASGTLTSNAFTTTNATASGTPTFFRLLTSAGVAKVQGTAGTSGTDAILSHSPITALDPIAVNSLTITMSGA